MLNGTTIGYCFVPFVCSRSKHSTSFGSHAIPIFEQIISIRFGFGHKSDIGPTIGCRCGNEDVARSWKECEAHAYDIVQHDGGWAID